MSAGQPADSPASPAGPPAGDDDTEYRTDAFRMNSMKVLPCSKRFVHDWTECPFAHPQEKARRRDPRLHNYTGIACPSMKKEGCCAFGDHCPYAHNVFEYWLHPTRYRTQLCNDGSNCKRKICFFAHSLDELRVPACKPFVSPEALAAAAASAASDAEAKRKAATVGSPLASFAAGLPGPSPQRSSFDAAARASADVRVAAPASPGTADDAAAMQPSPAEAAVHQALAQLAGAGFSSQDTQVIELVTSLLAQDRVSPEQAASILQQMLAPDALHALQARLNSPRGPGADARCFSDPLGYRSDTTPPSPQALRASFHGAGLGAAPHTAAAMLGQEGRGAGLAAQQQHPPSPSLEQLAAAQAAHQLGFPGLYPGATSFAQAHAGSLAQFQAAPPTGLPGWDAQARLSLESARSSFDTGAHPGLGGSSGSNSRSGSDDGGPPPQRQQAGRSPGGGPPPRPSVEAALRRMSAEQEVGGSAALAEQRQQYQRALLQTAAGAAELSQRTAAMQAALQERRQLLQQGSRPSEDSTRMSMERGSLDVGTPRGSFEAAFPPMRSSSSLPGPFYSGQLSSVPEQFPMINAPPPTWGSARFSYESASAADRLSQDLGRMSFEAAGGGRVAPQTADPYASSFFSAGPAAQPQLEQAFSAPLPADRWAPPLPALPQLRTPSSARSPGLDESSAARQPPQ